MDVVSKKKRSEMMSCVRQRDTKPEVLLRKQLHKLGLRYSLHDRKLPGTPDMKLAKYRAVIFVHGCFWHAHEGCKYATVPSTRKDYWENKFIDNRMRDKRIIGQLLDTGWRVLVVWECAIKKDVVGAAEQIVEWLESTSLEGVVG